MGLRTRTPFEDELLELIDPIAVDLGFRIVRLRLTGSGRPVLQIMAEDKNGHMNVDNCATLSRAISGMMEQVDPIKSEYVLEVSSPGVDRPLVTLQDFDTYAGFDAKFSLNRMVENKKRFRGTLAGIEDDNILVDLEGEDETAHIPFSWLQEAKLIITDALLKAHQHSAETSEHTGEDT